MKKKILLGAFLMAGTVFGFANDNVAAEKVEAVTVENRSEVKANSSEESENLDFATCVRCVRQVTTTIDDTTGESSSTTVQFCYEVACPF